jgi:tetratricopeptide (TPR) repeat protein
MTDPLPEAPESREIRVFLSSTFRDFMGERDLLVKQVFPSLRRRAKDRGVEVVDVDLRWGITEQESQQGKVIPICLAEIERCTPYFLGMLGERYGWIPPANQYSPELISSQPWLAAHLGGSSVTELEILHGVLNRSSMTGRAFFYLRDPAWSNAQAEPGFVCVTEEEASKLAALKDRIRASGYPVTEDLKDPQAIAERIEADLWDLINQLFPTVEQPNGLEKEERKHGSYRQARMEPYLGGAGYIKTIEDWIAEAKQRILITGESGAGKSALIANWVAAHGQAHPDDVIYCHHLGCSNDANAIRPLLARLIDTAKRLLPEEFGSSLSVPEDWWELVAKVAETLLVLGRWVVQNNRRWIWVLDGLDRLEREEQKALPWLPVNLPQGVVVVTSALECSARSILQEREYITLTIGPLQKAEQDELIQRYLARYTKQLDGGLRQEIQSHQLAGSPLFLRVLLEELRQCGRYETIAEQLQFYLNSEIVDDLYERVLERLENDTNGDAVKKVMTALWASRAGLSETELLAITQLAPLQWAPIDLALEQAFGRNSNRMVFDHDYLRKAVEDRYLPTEEQRGQAHSDLADWFDAKDGWDERDSEELPWQLQEADRLEDLREWLLDPANLAGLVEGRGCREVVNYWLAVKGAGDGELDELIAEAVEEEIDQRREDKKDLIRFVDQIAGLLEEAGLYRELLLRLRKLSLELEEASEERSEKSKLISLAWLANVHKDMGHYDEAEQLFLCCLEARERLMGPEHPSTLSTMADLGLLYMGKDDSENAESYLTRCLEVRERLLGPEHPSTLTAVSNLGLLYSNRGDYEQAEGYYTRCLEGHEQLLGHEHTATLTTVHNLGMLFTEKGDYEQAEAYLTRCMEVHERLLGPDHPTTIISTGSLGFLFSYKGDDKQAEAYFLKWLEASERLLGHEHPNTLRAAGNLSQHYTKKGDYEQAEVFYKRCLEAEERQLGPEHPSTLTTVNNLGTLYSDKGDYEQAEAYYKRCLEASERRLGPEHPETTVTRCSIAKLLSDQGRYSESIPLRRLELSIAEQRDSRNAQGSLTSIHQLADDLYWNNEQQESELLYREALVGRIAVLGGDHPDTMASRYGLARCFSAKEQYGEAIELRRVELAWCQANDDVDAKNMLISMHGLGCDLLAADETEEALEVLQGCLRQRQELLGPCDDDTLDTLTRVLDALSSLGKQEEGIALSRKTQQALEAELGRNDPKVFTQISNQANLHEELGDLNQAEVLYRHCLADREETLGADHAETMGTVFSLAGVLSEQEHHAEAIPLRRHELAWCREQNGDIDPGTLSSINYLAIDLRETGKFEEAESLFRELLAGRKQVLEPGDFRIGRALAGLAKTLEQAGKLEMAQTVAQQALNHRFEHEGPDNWCTNRSRLNLAQVLYKSGQHDQALERLNEALESMACLREPDADDQNLIEEINQLIQLIYPDN